MAIQNVLKYIFGRCIRHEQVLLSCGFLKLFSKNATEHYSKLNFVKKIKEWRQLNRQIVHCILGSLYMVQSCSQNIVCVHF